MLYKSHKNFLGLCLENAPIIKYEWQDKSKAYLLQRLSEHDFIEQVSDILILSSKTLDEQKLIWSNEILLKYSYRLIPIIERLEALNHEIAIVCYLREHRSWLKSAYEQFNIFSKTYSGNIKTYNQWAPKNVPQYFKLMEKLAEKHSSLIYVKFIETVDDLCVDFMNNVMGEEYSPNTKRDNAKRSAEELYLRAIFHDSKDEVSTAKDFNNSFRYLNTELSPDDYLNKLLEIKQLPNLASRIIDHDCAELTNVFHSIKLPESKEKSSPDCTVNNGKLLHTLTTIIMQQERRILALEELIRKEKAN